MEERYKFNIAVFMILALIGLGTLFYHYVEGWTLIDGVYFSATTLTTVGFGDLHPTTSVGKIFTIFYLLSGVSLTFYAITRFAHLQIEATDEKIVKRFSKERENPFVWAQLKKDSRRR